MTDPLTTCGDCGARPARVREAGWEKVLIHAFSCPQRREGDQARCDNPECRLVLDHEKVVATGKKTCDDRCRAKAWKGANGYGHRDPARRPAPPVRTASRKTSGLQVSYRKAVGGCVAALVECGIDREEAELLAEKHMRSALSAKQLATLEERETEPPSPTPQLLVPPEPDPAPQILPPEVEPTVTRDPAPIGLPTVHIYQSQRDDNDFQVWVLVDTINTRREPKVALIW